MRYLDKRGLNSPFFSFDPTYIRGWGRSVAWLGALIKVSTGDSGPFGDTQAPGRRNGQMFRVVEGLPEGVLGLEAFGRITHEDYRDVLIPGVESLLARGPVDMLYAIGEDFTGFDLEALWDDAAVGVRHWRDFRRVAVVADQQWIRDAVSMFEPFFPCEVRLFARCEMAAAKDWIVQSGAVN